MKFITLSIVIIFIKIKIYLSNSFLVKYHSEYISLTDSNGDIKNYNLELMSLGNKLYFDTNSNSFIQKNNLFYYLLYNDTTWKDSISLSKYYVSIYCDDFNTFNSKIDEILQEIRVNIRIKQIIIGCQSSCDKSEINLDKYKTDIKIFINKQRNEIKNKYSSNLNNIFCSIFIDYSYAGDVYADNLILLSVILLLLVISTWMYIQHNAKKNGKYLFIHGYILFVLFFYCFHTLLYFIISMKRKYKYFDEEIYSGALYNIFCFFQFFTKLLPALCATLQLNLLEINEHYRIIRNSKVIHILSANIFFVISLENENESLSEILNGLLYILVIICLFYMFMKFKYCLEDKIIDAIIDDPENVPTLKFKKKILISHSLSILIYTAIYYIIVFVSKNYFSEYRTIKFILVMINYSDLFLIFIFCGIYFPKQLPPGFVEEINNIEPEIDINNEENDYFENIYAYEQTDEEKYFEKYKAGDMACLVIIENPFNENKIEVEIEQEEYEEEEGEEKEEKEEEKNVIKVKGIENNENDKSDNHIETTEEDSIDNNKDNIGTINGEEEKEEKDEKPDKKKENKKKDNMENENENDIINSQNNEEEHNALVQEKKNIDVLNKSCIEEDILDISHTKLGYIEIS